MPNILPAPTVPLYGYGGYINPIWYRFFQTFVRETSSTAVIARLSADVTGVTGEGTNYSIIFDEEVYDRNSAYNHSTGIFTAPVTGLYFFSYCILVSGITASNTLASLANASTGIWSEGDIGTLYNGAGYVQLHTNELVLLQAGTQVQPIISVFGEASKNIDLIGPDSGNPGNFLSYMYVFSV